MFGERENRVDHTLPVCKFSPPKVRASTSRHDEFWKQHMRIDERRPRKEVEDRRPLRTIGIASGVALGIAVLGLATWFLVAGAQKQSHSPSNQAQAIPSRGAPPADALKDFVSVVLGDTEDVWREQFRTMKRAYKEPHLVLFTGRVSSSCGIVGSAIGPSYCPRDEKIYMDLSFFKELEDRYHASGDFARAYVIAHEVGHHVQQLLGIPEKERTRQPELSRDQKERLVVRLELQADYFAGVWAHHAQKARHILEPGDVEAVLSLLAAIGDDRLRLDALGDMDARSMTRCWDRRHGTAQQKVRWFRRGLQTGDMSQGETSDAAELREP
jgi:predicted metalloprotease